MTPGLEEISIPPGRLHLARRPSMLQTILGSCVGATFWSGRLGVGALCHGVLPRCPPGACGDEVYRYVDSSIRFLAEQFDLLGASRPELEVKLFGGADVLALLAGRGSRPTIGSLNCRVALAVLEEEGFRVTASDLAGTRGRSIHFHTGTGTVLVHRLAALPFRNERTELPRNPTRGGGRR